MPSDIRGGDFLLVHGSYPISRLIQICTGSRWNHAIMALDSSGNCAEALGNGIVKSRLETHEDRTFALVSPDYASLSDRQQAIDHAQWVVGEGWKYGYATFFGMLLFWLTGGDLMVSGGAKAAICSGFVADCLHAGAIRFPEKHPMFYTPADLGRRFSVEG